MHYFGRVEAAVTATGGLAVAANKVEMQVVAHIVVAAAAAVVAGSSVVAVAAPAVADSLAVAAAPAVVVVRADIDMVDAADEALRLENSLKTVCPVDPDPAVVHSLG